MSDPIVAEGVVTLRGTFDALLLHVKPRPLLAVLGLLLVASGIGVCFLPPRTVGAVVEPSSLLPALLAFLFLYAFAYVPWRVRRLYRQRSTSDQAVRYEASDAGLAVRWSRGEANFPWSDFRRWRSNPRVSLLYQTDEWFIVVHASLLPTPDAYTAFQALVQRHLGEPG